MDCKKRRYYPYDLKKVIIQKVKDGIKRSDIQKEYGISPSSLSRWICPPEKIIDEVNGEIRPVLENYTDEGMDKDYDADIDAENESDKSENESSQYERNAEENRKKRGREFSSDENSVLRKKRKVLRKKPKVLRKKQSLDNKKRRRDSSTDDSSLDEYNPLRKKRRLDSNKFKKGGSNVCCKKHHIDSNEFKKGGGNVKDHLT